jgi:probable HAF family extracellular repeat protein
MKPRSCSSILVTTLFALANVALVHAQEQSETAGDETVREVVAKRHHHYKLIVLETFGGPTSSLNMTVDANDRGLNRHGLTIGFAATSTPKLPTSNPIICGGDDTFGSNITHALRWQNGTVTDLQALPPVEINCSNAYQLNSSGEIVGFSENGEFDPVTGTNQSRAVRWKDGKIEDLGSFGGNQNEALGINNKGQIVGFSLNTTPDPYSIWDNILNVILGSTGGTQTRAVLWDHGKMHDLGTLGGDDAAAFYINDRGQIAGVSYTSPVASIPVTGVPPLTAIPPQDAFLWENGKMVDLGNLGGGYAMFTGQGGGLNNRGQVIGVSSVPANPLACFFLESDPNCHPFLWDGSKLIDLAASTTGGSPITAQGINDRGDIVGQADFSSTGGSSADGYLWKDGVATDLGDAPGDCSSAAQAINFSGQVVGNSFSCDNGFDRAFLWENGSIVDLNSLIPPGSPIRLVDAKDINDRGEIAGDGVLPGVDPNNVAGGGTNPGLGVRAFLLIPCDAGHPNVEGCHYSMVDSTDEPRAGTDLVHEDVSAASALGPVISSITTALCRTPPLCDAGSLIVTAQITDQVRIAKVQFFANGRLDQTLTRPPYQIEYGARLGKNVVTVTATDVMGHTATRSLTWYRG